MNNRSLLFAIALLLLLMSSALVLAQSSPALTAASGVDGQISVSPVSGGPTRQGMPDAKPLPDVEFVVKQGDRVVTSFRTDSEGRFRISLGPGHYSIVRKEGNSAIGSFGPFEVDVTKAKMTSVQWKCDTGIR